MSSAPGVRRAVRWAALVGVVALTAALIGRASATHASMAHATNDTNVATVRVRRMDLVATEQVTGALGYAPAPAVVNHLTGTYTAFPAEGAVIQPDQSLFAVDGQPVMLLEGTIPAWRSFAPGMTDGFDVAELQHDLTRTDAGLRVDGHYGPSTATAVRTWRLAHGLVAEQTLPFGTVVFLGGSVRVGPRNVGPGDAAQPGQSPYATTGTDRVVTIQLDVARRGDVRAGQPASIELPSGTRVPGHITSVGRVARIPTAPSGNTTPAVTVIVAPDSHAVTDQLDEEPVAVDLVTEQRRGVLAVPITALLGLAEGGCGVEVVEANGVRRIVAVAPGLFADTMVEITGAGINQTTTVVTAR